MIRKNMAAEVAHIRLLSGKKLLLRRRLSLCGGLATYYSGLAVCHSASVLAGLVFV